MSGSCFQLEWLGHSGPEKYCDSYGLVAGWLYIRYFIDIFSCRFTDSD